SGVAGRLFSGGGGWAFGCWGGAVHGYCWLLGGLGGFPTGWVGLRRCFVLGFVFGIARVWPWGLATATHPSSCDSRDERVVLRVKNFAIAGEIPDNGAGKRMVRAALRHAQIRSVGAGILMGGLHGAEWIGLMVSWGAGMTEGRAKRRFYTFCASWSVVGICTSDASRRSPNDAFAWCSLSSS
ncbi:hypothetical protein EXIGLDRAFT_798611, partial [Exidia glandulosa HHB12029]